MKNKSSERQIKKGETVMTQREKIKAQEAAAAPKQKKVYTYLETLVLPALEGSEKQIAWAESIRKNTTKITRLYGTSHQGEKIVTQESSPFLSHGISHAIDIFSSEGFFGEASAYDYDKKDEMILNLLDIAIEALEEIFKNNLAKDWIEKKDKMHRHLGNKLYDIYNKKK
jgi:hypothetical protein